MPERVDFWGLPESWGSPALYTYTIMGVAALILVYRFFLQASLWWRIGRPETRWNKLHIRLGRVVNYVILQIRTLQQTYPGVMHAGIAWGFFIFFLGTALATIDSHFIKFLRGNTYLLYKFVLDISVVFFLVGAGMAAYRRLIQRPSRLTLKPDFVISLTLIVVIVLGGLLTESFRLAVERPAWAFWAPMGWLLSQLWLATGASSQALLNWHNGIWVFHLLSVAGTLIFLPVTPLLHILTGTLNTFFSNIDRPIGQLAPPGQNKQGEAVYVHYLSDLTWKQLLDAEACTECGRCQEACPAFAAGTPLNPKQLILNVRNALRQQGRIALKKNNGGQPLVGELVRDDTLWSCTTCAACMRECPVLIEHVDAIVDMRRYLVAEGRVDDKLQTALMNLGRYGNSFGQSERARPRWTQSLETKIKDIRKEPAEYLWFVGDYASYNAGLADVTRMTAEVFQRAGLDFGILYEGERNAGNDVRRVGEEGLFEVLVEKNTSVIAKCQYRSIITTDPHSYNTLKNEYSWDQDGRRPVLHYSELLLRLINSGQIKLTKELTYKVTYHDPCYLARYNGITIPPRRVIQATGCALVEMPRHGNRTFCCGAGGGRIWMEEGEVKERPSEARIREAMNLDGVNVLVVACPKDLAMYRDAVKTTGNENRLIVKDLVELVYEAM